MSALVCIDSQIFIWGIKRQSKPDQKNMIELAVRFIDKLSREDAKLLLPVPMMTELLSPVPVSDHASIISLMDKRFLIAPFDNLAAIKCAELLHTVANEKDIQEYKENHSIPKAKIKYDCMIAAIAITRRASIIYSNDADLKKFACGQINVVPMPLIPVQTDLFGDLIREIGK